MNTLMRPGSNIFAVYLELPARVLALCILAILPGPVFGAYGCNSGGGVAVPDAPAKPEETAKVAPAPAVEKPVDPVAMMFAGSNGCEEYSAISRSPSS